MISEKIQKAIQTAVASLGMEVSEIVLEHPGELLHGDYATNVAMALAKKAGVKPKDLAEQIATAIRAQNIPEIAKVEVAGPGFINFHLSLAFLVSEIAKIVSDASQYGLNRTLVGKVVMVEYTSPNLFKPLHIGNLVGNILGESLSRLLIASGAEVKRINYPSDIGLTVAKGVWGLQKTNGNPKDIKALGEAYRIGNTAYEEAGEEKKEIELINKALYEDSNSTLTTLRKEGIATSLSHLETLCKKLGTKFDTQFFESQSAPLGRDIVIENTSRGIFEKSDGAVVYKGEAEGLHTRVFLNSQGLPTYEAKEVGLFKLKSGAYPNFNTSITVTGNEQLDFFKVVFSAIKKVFKEETKGKVLHHVPNGFLTLTTGKMSSRKGNVITGESLIETVQDMVREKVKDRGFDVSATETVAEAVAIGAIKYSILRQQMGSNIIFDFEKSLSFEGDSGPYLQYTTVRGKTVLAKAKVAGLIPSTKNSPKTTGDVERLIYRFPEVLLRATQDYAPHLLVTFAIELSASFNAFYANQTIIDEKDPESPYRLALTSAVVSVLEQCLHVLAIPLPEKM
ncbi:arginine--tRNA ligase [Patescibacteria group bacterium]|nr:MAG: arginine--tRNA ligase [Patescibacteria group bacterium]